jgi:perosamine synthetase
MYTIQTDEKIRDPLQKHLTEKGIMTKVYFDPIHLKSYYKREFKYHKGDLPQTEDLSRRVLTLPMYPQMTETELEYVKDSIEEFLS